MPTPATFRTAARKSWQAVKAANGRLGMGGAWGHQGQDSGRLCGDQAVEEGEWATRRRPRQAGAEVVAGVTDRGNPRENTHFEKNT